MLSRADELSLRWVFVYDPGYYDALLEAGYSLQDVWPNGVTLFEKADVTPIADSAPQPRTGWGLFWGLVPLSVLSLVVLLALLELRSARARATLTDPA